MDAGLTFFLDEPSRLWLIKERLERMRRMGGPVRPDSAEGWPESRRYPIAGKGNGNPMRGAPMMVIGVPARRKDRARLSRLLARRGH